MERRLVAIVAADVVGYSRLIRENESGTLASVKAHRENLIEPIVSSRNGRIVKLMGDGLLIEFASAVEAVQFAIEFQHFIGVENNGIEEKYQIQYRIGINIGDIVVEDNDIFGDGVNLAARLESLADPGGIYVADNVFHQIKNKLDLNIKNLGEHQVKNIAEPVAVFSVLLDDKALALVSPIAPPAIGDVISPGKPSIAVLAFNNLNNDTKVDYISDGLSENILTALSRFPDFFVIARNSTFSYKDKSVATQQIAQELGVRYVVEGSVQVAGQRLRATAQLIDATRGNHLWAEQYDRSLQDIFAVQDEITRTIASTLVASINLAEYDRLKHQPTDNLGAYELYKRAQQQAFKFTKEGNIRAMQLSQQAIKLDPSFASPYIELAFANIFGYRWGWSENTPRDVSLACAFESARKAIEIEPFNFKAHQVLAMATTQTGDLAKAISIYDKAIFLNPNSDSVLADSSDPLVYSGRAVEAVDRMKTAIRLNPHYQDWYLWNLGWAQYFAKDYKGALASIEKMNKVPDRLKRTLAPILLRLGRDDDARKVIGEFLKAIPDYDLDEAKTAPFKNDEYLNRWLGDLRKLGVPESAS